MDKKVKVFSTPTCPYCNLVKAYLKENKISFNDVDVSKDQAAALEMIGKSRNSGVPQLWIDDKVIIGFDQGAIDQALGL